MNMEKALSIVERQIPCGHHNYDPNIGNGKIWAKCEDCGKTFQQSSLDVFRKSETDFDEAMATIRQALKDNKAMYSDGESVPVLEGGKNGAVRLS